MKKELIVCIGIISFIIIMDVITQKYTVNSVETIANNLNELKNEIKDGEILISDIEKNMDNLFSEWEKKHDKLAYYIEHDELEKVELYLVGLKSYIQSNKKKEAIGELDKCTFILEHIKDKQAFNIQNIF